MKLNLAKGVALDSAKNVVQFIKDKNNPGKDLRRAMRRIPLSDYEVIEAGLKSDTQGESEKLAEREGHELISIPIDTHTKAEGALLELGNLLGYDTYVTADDRNKKYRDIPLAEIATLQELPNSIAQSILNTVRHIDVIWFKEELPEYCIEVEHSTDITRGLLRLYQLRGLKTSFMVVAPAEARDKFKREVEKAPFHSIRDRFRFNSYDDLTRFLAVAETPDKPVEALSFVSRLLNFTTEDIYRAKIARFGTLLEHPDDRKQVVHQLGHGIEAFNSVPTAIFAFLSHPQNFASTVIYAVSLGGDTDTIASMAGAISGAYLGIDALSSEWQGQLKNRDYILSLADRLWQLASAQWAT